MKKVVLPVIGSAMLGIMFAFLAVGLMPAVVTGASWLADYVPVITEVNPEIARIVFFLALLAAPYSFICTVIVAGLDIE